MTLLKERKQEPLNRKPIAVIGIGCWYPGARDPLQFWENILSRRLEFRALPDCRLPLSDYCDPSGEDVDKIYAKRAALMDGFEFDWINRRIPKLMFESTDLVHWLSVEVAEQAIFDAGYTKETLDKDATGVLVGNTLTGDITRAETVRLRWPLVRRALRKTCHAHRLPESAIDTLTASMEKTFKSVFSEPNPDTLAGGLANTIAGRVCNYFDLHGGGYIVDGACSSSLLAVYTAAQALSSGDLNAALVGGVDLSIDPFELVGFSRAGALSKGDMNVYDKAAAGFIPGEGCGFVMLKRLEDARRDGDTVYAVLRGWGISSDGKGGIMTPTSSGQALAIRRAYASAGYSPADLDFVEGHGTGTSVGDMVELKGVHEAQTHPDNPNPPSPRRTGMTSLKSIVGHTKAAAGIGAFIKATMAVNRRVLPPTGSCTVPNATFNDTCDSLYPLVHGTVVDPQATVRAGVSAMGFGGINSHVTIESGDAPVERLATKIAESSLMASNQTSEIFVWTATTFEELSADLTNYQSIGRGLSCSDLIDLSADLTDRAVNSNPIRAVIVATSTDELIQRLHLLEGMIDRQRPDVGQASSLPEGHVWLSNRCDCTRVGFLFPGQGSQQVAMARKLVARFDWAREMLAQADQVQTEAGLATVTQTVFANAERAIGREHASEMRRTLARTENAQVAIVTVSAILSRYLDMMGIQPVACGGHSLGELTALYQAGAFDFSTLLRVVSLRGQAMASATDEVGAMAAILCSRDIVDQIIANTPGYAVVANVNSPNQLVVSGDEEAINAIIQESTKQNISAAKLNVSNAFHSKYVDRASQVLRSQAQIPATPERLDIDVFSGINGQPLESNVQLNEYLARQVVESVDFVSMVQNMEGQCDLLIEVGPGNVLTRLAAEILQSKNLICLPAASKPDVDCCMNFLLARSFAHGVDIRWNRLFENRLHRQFVPASDRIFIKNPCENELADLGEVEALSSLVASGNDSQSDPDTSSPLSRNVKIDNTSDSEMMTNKQNDSAMPALAQSPQIDDGVEELILTTIEARTGFPKTTLTPDLRLLDDLNLDSIKAGDIVATAAREMEIEGAVDPANLGDATIADLVAAIRMARNGGVPTVEGTATPTKDHTSEPLGAMQGMTAPGTLSPMTPDSASRTANSVLDAAAANDMPPAPAEDVVTDWVRNFTIDLVEHRPVSEQLDISNRHFHVLYDASHGYFIELLARRIGERKATASFELYDNSEHIIGDAQPAGTTLYTIALLPREIALDTSRNKLQRMVHRLHRAVATTNPRTNQQPVKGITFAEFGNGRFGTEGITDVERSGTAAFARALHLESPNLEVRVIDFADELSDFLATDFITNEIATADPFCNAAYDRLGRRFEARHRMLQPEDDKPLPLALGNNDVILVTGGARGITAECALALAQRTGANFALVGSSPHPSQSMGAAAEEIGKTLERFASLPGKSEYFACDLTNENAVRELIVKIESTFGRVTGVIHGAGRNAPGAANGATLEQALHEVSPKVLGIANLLESLADRPLRCLIGLTSIIGVTGIPGNSWYAFSNETLDLILRHYKNQHPESLVRSISYSAWSEVGMGAKGNVEANLRRMGVGMIPLQQGVERFMHAMEHDLEDVQMLVTSSLGGIDTWRPVGQNKCTRDARFIDKVVHFEPSISLKTRVKLDHQNDPYLKDHIYSGTCLFPAVLGMEAMAQVASHLMPEKPTVIRIQNVELPKPIIVGEEGSVELEIHALAAEKNSRGETIVSVGIRSERTQFQQDHFAAEIVFGEVPMGTKQPVSVGDRLDIDPQRDLYNGIMFQGPLFQRWGDTYHLEHGLMRLDVKHSEATCRGEGVFAETVPSGSLLTGDVFYRDVLLQSIQALIPQRIGLPLSIEKIEFFGADPTDEMQAASMQSHGMDSERRFVLSKMNVIGDKVGDQHVCEVVVKDKNGRVREHMTGYRVKVLAINEDYPTAAELADLTAYDQQQFRQQTAKTFALMGIEVPVMKIERMPGLHQMKTDERHRVERPMMEATARAHLENSGRGTASPQIDWMNTGRPTVVNEPDCKISLSHDDDYCLCIANKKIAGCDIAPITPRSREQWNTLVGHVNALLIDELISTGDCVNTAGTRLWSAVEAAKKSIDQAIAVPLKIDSVHDKCVSFVADCLSNAVLLTTPVSLHRSPARMLSVVAPKATAMNVAGDSGMMPSSAMSHPAEMPVSAMAASAMSGQAMIGQSSGNPVLASTRIAPSMPGPSGRTLMPSRPTSIKSSNRLVPSQPLSAREGDGTGNPNNSAMSPSKPIGLVGNRSAASSQAEMLAMAKMATAAMSPEEAQLADAEASSDVPVCESSSNDMAPAGTAASETTDVASHATNASIPPKELAPPDVIRAIDDITAVHKWDGPQDQAVFEYKFPVTFKECAKKGKHVQDSQFVDWMGQLRENALLYLCPEIAHKLSDGLSGMATNWTDVDIVGEMMMGDMVIARFFREEMTEATINLVCDFCKLLPDGRLMRVAFVRQAATWVELEGKRDPMKAAFPKFLADALRKVAPRSSDPPNYEDRISNLGRLKLEQQRLEASTVQAPAVLWVEEFQTTSADSNIVQNLYHSRYFNWQWRTSDLFLYNTVPQLVSSITNLGSVKELIPLNSHIDYVRDAFPFDRVRTELAVTRMTECAATLQFTHSRRLESGEWQKLAVCRQDAVWVRRTPAATAAPEPFPRAVREALLHAVSSSSRS